MRLNCLLLGVDNVLYPFHQNAGKFEFFFSIKSNQILFILSRYVLVTFPEVPLRYNAPSYVERLLLPERFPNLFQNIVQSYDQHLTTTNRIPHYRPTK
jgi:hypothetical protein